MKSKHFICAAAIFAACAFSANAYAQLTIASTGNIGISVSDTIEPLSLLSIGGIGHLGAKVAVYENEEMSGNKYVIMSKLEKYIDDTTYAIFGKNVGGLRQIGVYGEGILNRDSVSPLNTIAGLSCGVWGKAEGASQFNYGVLGQLLPLGYGAGIFGTIDGTEPFIASRYAGYFLGKTKVNGDLYATTINTTSDARLKTNVTNLTSDVRLKLQALQPIQFNWQQVEDSVKEDDAISINSPHLSTDINMEQMHYGFLAQDVQKILPELVQEDDAGYLSINYIEMIPLLVNAVQQLSSEVEELKKVQSQGYNQQKQ